MECVPAANTERMRAKSARRDNGKRDMITSLGGDDWAGCRYRHKSLEWGFGHIV